jgi:hypothetical protein
LSLEMIGTSSLAECSMVSMTAELESLVAPHVPSTLPVTLPACLISLPFPLGQYSFCVALTLSKSNDSDAGFLRLVPAHLTSHLSGILKDKAYLVAVLTNGVGDTSLLICRSNATKAQRAVLLTMSKFIGHVDPLPNPGAGTVWFGHARGLAWNGYDETALGDVLQKCARELIDPSHPQPGPGFRGIDEILASACTHLHRLLPRQAFAELRDANIRVPVLLVAIRPVAQPATHGQIPGAMIMSAMFWTAGLAVRSAAIGGAVGYCNAI